MSYEHASFGTCVTLSDSPWMQAQKRPPVLGNCFLPTAARRMGALREVGAMTMKKRWMSDRLCAS